ncbi:TPA: DUF6530 family protein [Yersinia enterocolitica]|uniref:Uncharacterized protein n=1 Tax=Yersinia aleksiciae TaxID=263819 RepID=A0A0T9V1Q0_YERAE|nr:MULTISPECIES: DUF6530 family protein [Yersinia]RXA93701.1 hypothetical protein EQP49_22700 [Yersinia sp. 2105 StPb PI]CNL94370.1 Uncharacterised protein [Yersinia aleksiciae]CQD57593.1 Uncharacterised protein [Yersinia enterocolitica]
MKIPTHLKHKPIIEIENYDRIDGPYAEDTDAMGLSVGIAQWNAAGLTDLSAKVWRNTGEKWSRQSEELPLHRAIDLATLVCVAMDYSKNGRLSSSDEFPVSRAINNPELARHTELMKKELKENEAFLDASLKRLSEELKRIGY